MSQTPTNDPGRFAGSLAPTPPVRDTVFPVTPVPRRRRRSALPAVLIAGSLAAVAATSGGTWWFTHRDDHGPADSRPVALPATLGGFPVYPHDFGADGTWARLQVSEKTVDASHALGGRGYAATADGRLRSPLMNMTVIRGRYPEFGDLRMARPPYIKEGDVTCTKTLDLTAGMSDAGRDAMAPESKGPTYSETQTECWRVSERLTVSILALGRGLSVAQVAAAVREGWAAQE